MGFDFFLQNSNELGKGFLLFFIVFHFGVVVVVLLIRCGFLVGDDTRLFHFPLQNVVLLGVNLVLISCFLLSIAIGNNITDRLLFFDPRVEFRRWRRETFIEISEKIVRRHDDACIHRSVIERPSSLRRGGRWRGCGRGVVVHGDFGFGNTCGESGIAGQTYVTRGGIPKTILNLYFRVMAVFYFQFSSWSKMYKWAQFTIFSF